MAKHKTAYGMPKAKKAASPTGKPSKVKQAVKDMKAGDASGGTRPKKKAKAKKKGFVKGTIPKVEQALRKAGA